jgi:two-component system, OmpR family, sensor histidine kinase KdpD
MRQRPGLGLSIGEPQALVAGTLEALVAVALATAGVAALQSTTPTAGLGVLYLPAVLAVAIRRGQLAALATAVVSVLTLNYFFITPRHRLAIAHSQDVVELAVMLIAAIVGGRLAAIGRERAAEAERRAAIAAAREREANLLADAASAILADVGVTAQLRGIGKRIADATGASTARLALEPVPAPGPEEIAVLLHARTRKAWLYVSTDAGWERSEIERLAHPLGQLVDVALERQRIAERDAENAAAQRAEVAKTAILRAISHDLRSPLTAITTAGSALRGAALSDDERAELVDVIRAESDRLAKLVDDLLDLSRIEAGAVTPRVDWCDLHDVVASALAHLRTEHPIEFALPVELPLVSADSAQLERVFSNLLDNAIKFSPPRAPVRISGGANGGRVTVRITDDGPGIPRQQRARVFEPFFRGKRDGASNAGLGLAICRGFVEANGGRIVLQARDGRGTSFAVSFPVARHAEPVASATK